MKTPSREWLEKMAENEDSVGSVSAGETDDSKEEIGELEKILAESEKENETLRKQISLMHDLLIAYRLRRSPRKNILDEIYDMKNEGKWL